MFCQHCGAELRTEAGFCAVCGATAPQPRLHADQPEPTERGRTPPDAKRPAAPTLPPLAAVPPASNAGDSPPANVRPTYEAIRQASSYRGATRQVAPAASLEVRAVSPAPTAQAGEQPQSAGQNGREPHSLNGTHPVGPTSAAPPSRLEAGGTGGPSHTDPSSGLEAGGTGGYTDQTLQSLAAVHLPQDMPNRLVLVALACMFASFFLPWLIIGGVRATPLSVGWPVALPLVVILGAFLTVLLPERLLYARFLLALPLNLGCFALGAALLLFLLSSAVAANSVGVSFLGMDIGFALFVLAALVLTGAGYYKLLRELPLLQAGLIRLSPLPGVLGALFERPAPASPPAATHPLPSRASSPLTASAPLPLDQAGSAAVDR